MTALLYPSAAACLAQHFVLDEMEEIHLAVAAVAFGVVTVRAASRHRRPPASPSGSRAG